MHTPVKQISFSNYIFTNDGETENRGIEFSLDMIPLLKNDIKLQFGFNLAYNQNEFTNLSDSDPSFMGYTTGSIIGGVGNSIQINTPGYPLNSFFVLQQVYDSKGMPVEGFYVDRSGMGGNVSGNSRNMYRWKKPDPDFTFGLQLHLTYKNWEFSSSGHASIGNYVYDNLGSAYAIYSNLYNISGYINNIPKSVNETGFQNQQLWSDYYIKNASFFRLDNITLAYSFKSKNHQGQNIKIYSTAQNLLLFTKYDGINPEIYNGIAMVNPYAKTFLLGIALDI